MILSLHFESSHKGSDAPSSGFQWLVQKGWDCYFLWLGSVFWVSFSALILFIWWQEGLSAHKNLCHFSLKVSRNFWTIGGRRLMLWCQFTGKQPLKWRIVIVAMDLWSEYFMFDCYLSCWHVATSQVCHWHYIPVWKQYKLIPAKPSSDWDLAALLTHTNNTCLQRVLRFEW